MIEAWGAEGVASWDAAGKDQTGNSNSKNESELTWEIRIKTFVDKLCQLKNDVQNRRRVSRLAIPQCRLKSDLFRGSDRGIVQAVS